MDKEVHVLPAENNQGWNVKISGNDKILKHFQSKEEAILYGRQLNIHIKGNLIIHEGKDG